MKKLLNVNLEKQITIDGKFILFYKSLSIHQYLYKHHSFELTLDLEAVEKAESHTLENSTKWLGKTLVSEIYGRPFVGIISDISIKHDDGGLNGIVIIKGFSKTILLENGHQLKSWVNRSLYNIAEELIEEANDKIVYEINPQYKDKIPYLCQYNESNFNFLQRLAHQYNEWFYFDGFRLFFGKPNPKDETINVEYGQNLSELELKIQTFNHNITTYSYDSLKDIEHKGTAKIEETGLNFLAKTALKTSKKIHKNNKDFVNDTVLTDQSSVNDYLLKRQQQLSAKGNILIAKGDKRNLRIGTKINVTASKNKGKKLFSIKKYGEYIITEIKHFADGQGEYYNKFKAVPASVNMLPANENIKPQTIGNQVATVINNKDPENKGRVQVQFLVHNDLFFKTNFIRVISPNAGKSDEVNVNRGFVFIPEEQDQVMLGFEDNDPNRPYVIGSLFTGKTGAGGGDLNNIKTIITRSGNKLIMNDKKGSITIADPSGNVVLMKGNGQIIINAPNSLTLASKDINIMASNSINVMAEPNENAKNGGDGIININAKKNIDVKAQEESINITAKTDLALKSSDATTTVYAKTDMTIEAGTSATLNSEKMDINGGSQLTITSSDTDIM